MSGAIFSGVAAYLRPFLASFFTGTAVKIMDDHIDTPLDALVGNRTWAAELKEAALPYALLALSLGFLAEPNWSATLFWASYAVGMRGDLNRPLALGLTGWQETAIVGVVISPICGWQALLTSWAAVFSIQGIDDLIDQKTDKAAGADNWATRWGVIETSLLVAIAIGIVACLDVTKLVLVFGSCLLIIIILHYGARKRRQDGCG